MSDLVGNPEDRFSRVEAHLLMNQKQNNISWFNPHSALPVSGISKIQLIDRDA